MSLSLCPGYVPSLIALANMELLIIENTNTNTNKLLECSSSKPIVSNDRTHRKLYRGIINDKEITVMDDCTEIENKNFVCMNSDAYGYAMSAVRARHLNPECWYVLGRVYQAFGLPIEAGEAFTLSLKRLRNDPVRPYGTVLDDSLIMLQPQDAINMRRL